MLGYDVAEYRSKLVIEEDTKRLPGFTKQERRHFRRKRLWSARWERNTLKRVRRAQ